MSHLLRRITALAALSASLATPVMAQTEAIDGFTGRPIDCFCQCEARSAVAIHVDVRTPMDCFVPRNDRAGAMRGRGVMTPPPRHCEARSARRLVEIPIVIKEPSFCNIAFKPRP